MTSRERIWAAVRHEQTDIVPANFECVSSVMAELKAHYGFTEDEQVCELFGSDIRAVAPRYIGPKHEDYVDTDGFTVGTGFWGECYKKVPTAKGFSMVPCNYPLDKLDTIEDLQNYTWPQTDWFDYDSIKEACAKYPDKALTIGFYGPFQFAAHLRGLDKLLMDMILEPEYAHYLFDRMVQFELEHYERILQAAEGRIDILKACDDYGMQNGPLFSLDLWHEYFEENTKKLVNLAHKYGALYHQHSCGSMEPFIPALIECGIDILEPIQKVKGMDVEELKKKYGSKITFLGGIDTQTVLPYGTAEEVIAETKRVMDAMWKDGGYILMASQSFEEDVPIENIRAMYSVRNPALLEK